MKTRKTVKVSNDTLVIKAKHGALDNNGIDYASKVVGNVKELPLVDCPKELVGGHLVNHDYTEDIQCIAP